MSLYPIFSIITVFLALVFALLHLLVSLSELKKGKKTLGIYLLFIGSSLATFSLILYFLLPIVALFIWLIGVSLICYGAYWNGKHKENFHLAHHVIRIGIALILTTLLALI
ncbi:glucuronide permease [Streptococcus sp. HMSC064H09]|uniref:glucuronide permease n=1 Tax=Streptococcus sp. HMSC064H09 TaxID=1739371 RepID=UPI0008A292FD|nr:glucuronide permease [Streptococcus sp. HMSC064H09]OFR76902.1 glucuronide permease [Streptococcus sp. HMSC064H09]